MRLIDIEVLVLAELCMRSLSGGLMLTPQARRNTINLETATQKVCSLVERRLLFHSQSHTFSHTLYKESYGGRSYFQN